MLLINYLKSQPSSIRKIISSYWSSSLSVLEQFESDSIRTLNGIDDVPGSSFIGVWALFFIPLPTRFPKKILIFNHKV